MATLTFTADDRAETSLSLLGSSGYDLLDLDVTPVARETEYSGPRGALGRRPVSSSLPNRNLSLTFRVTASSKDQLASRLESLFDVVRLMHEHGGTASWQSTSQTYSQHAQVLTAGAGELAWSKSSEAGVFTTVVVNLVCAPYLEGDPMDLEDAFDTDTSADYTVDAGASSDITIGSGKITSDANHTTEKRLIHTARGYTYGDVQATLEALVPTTLNGFKAGVVLKRVDASNYVECFVDDDGTNSRIRINVVESGSPTTTETENLASRLTAGDRIWIRGRLEGGHIFVEIWEDGNPVYFYRNPDAEDDDKLPSTVSYDTEGEVGFVWIPNDSTAELGSLEVWPYTYGMNEGHDSALDAIRQSGEAGAQLRGAIPGDAPAKVELVTRWDQNVPGGTDHIKWAMLAWSRRPDPWSMVANGEFPAAQGTDGWSTAAVSGITAAATSITRVTTQAKHGISSAEVVCTATTLSGVHYRLFHHFRVGVLYTAEVWVRSDSDTDLVQLRLGKDSIDGDSAGVSLSTSWQKITASWRPTGAALGFTSAYVAVRVSGTGAPTFQMDGIRVYEGSTAPPESDRLLDVAPRPAFGYYDGRAEGRSGALGSGKTATTKTGAVDLEYCEWDSSVDAGGQSYGSQFYLGPHLVDEDELVDGEALVEVWARLLMSTSFTGGVTASVAWVPDSSLAEPIYGMEHGSTGRTLTQPNGTSEFFIYRLDTLPIPAGPKRGAMSGYISLSVTVAAGTNLQPIGCDWLMLVNPRRRASTPTEVSTNDTPYFRADLSSGLEYASRVRVASDLSAINESIGARTPNPGMGGALLEFPPGDVDAVFLESTRIPNDTNTSDNETRYAPDLHFSIVPRWHLLRPS